MRCFRRFEVVEQSMAPALNQGDYVVTRRSHPTRGSIVVFAHPYQPGFLLIKRVIAMAGDQVAIKDGTVTTSGATDTYARGPTRPDGAWVVPPDHVFVLGDSRTASTADSRQLGPIPTPTEIDIAVFRYWPLRRFGRIR